MLVRSMTASGGGGTPQQEIEVTKTYNAGASPYTVSELTTIRYIYYYYQGSLYGSCGVGEDGGLEFYDKYNGQYGGIDSVSGNVIKFHWNAGVNFVFVIRGYA